MVFIGGASINEYGKGEGGQPGDQTGKEVYIQPWYLHKKGWIVIRAKSDKMRAKLAQDMAYACENDYIGYSFWEHCYSLYEIVKKLAWDCSKVRVKCETNCAKLVLVSARYAGSNVEDFYTGDEVEKFRATGDFEILTDPQYCEKPDLLLKGDILVTKTQGHTVIVLSDGDLVNEEPYRIANCAYCNIRKGSNVNTKVLATVPGGTKVMLLCWAENGWGRVKYGDIIGYVSPLYLEPDCQYAMIKGNDTWLRDKPGAAVGKAIVVIPEGTTVPLTGNTETVSKTVWYEVIYDGITGWASGKYVKPI